MPKHFKISPLLNKISSWLISLLQRLPAREQFRELHTTTKLDPGGDGKNTASQLAVATFTWMDSANRRKFSCSGLLPWLSDPDNSQGNAMRHCLREQSEVPSHMWYRPSWQRADITPQKMQITNLASFYQDGSKPFEMKIPSKPSKKPYHFQSSMN
jgi:hypothetical protein